MKGKAVIKTLENIKPIIKFLIKDKNVWFYKNNQIFTYYLSLRITLLLIPKDEAFNDNLKSCYLSLHGKQEIVFDDNKFIITKDNLCEISDKKNYTIKSIDNYSALLKINENSDRLNLYIENKEFSYKNLSLFNKLKADSILYFFDTKI